MIINTDARALDWLTALYLSQDKAGMQEWQDGVDQHTLNQDAFGLPTRKIAKQFLFRAIFLGSAYAYANDPEFTHVSSNKNFWQGVIDRFFDKYSGFKYWVDSTVDGVIRNKGIYTLCTGRTWHHEMIRGEWPVTQIANFPIQSLEAEIMKLFRIAVYRRLKAELPEVKLFCSVHDSLTVDSPEKYMWEVKRIFDEEAAKIPYYLKYYYGIDFNLPFRIESSYGPNYCQLTEFA